MKKIICLLALACALSACSAIKDANKEGSSKAKLTACMTNEATAKFQAGTLSAANIKATATEITAARFKKLALPSSEQDTTEANKTASGILKTLLNSRNAK